MSTKTQKDQEPEPDESENPEQEQEEVEQPQSPEPTPKNVATDNDNEEQENESWFSRNMGLIIFIIFALIVIGIFVYYTMYCKYPELAAVEGQADVGGNISEGERENVMTQGTNVSAITEVSKPLVNQDIGDKSNPLMEKMFANYPDYSKLPMPIKSSVGGGESVATVTAAPASSPRPSGHGTSHSSHGHRHHHRH